MQGEMRVEPADQLGSILVAHVRIGDRGNMIEQPAAEAGTLFGGVERLGGEFVLPQPIDQGLGLVDQRLHRLAPPAFDQIVGILALRKGDEARASGPGPMCGRARSAARIAACWPAASPSKQRIGRGDQPPHPLELAFGQCGAERRDRLADPGLVDRDHVHIAFDHDQPPGRAAGRAGAIEVEERAALVEQRRIGRVEVFGLAIAEDPAAECDRPPARVADRDHQPAAETVVGLLAVLLRPRSAGRPRPACRRRSLSSAALSLPRESGAKPKPKRATRRLGYAAPLEIGARVRARDSVELLREPARRPPP